MEEFKTILNVTKIPSVNAMYLSGRGGGRYMNPIHKEVKDSIIKQLKEAKMPDFSGVPKGEYHVYHLDLVLAFKNRFDTRDASNCVKLIEDAIQDVANVDDSNNYEVRVNKVYFDDILDDKLERIYLSFTSINKKDIPWKHSEWTKQQKICLVT